MVYLEFGENTIRLVDEAGKTLWAKMPPGMWRCQYCGTFVANDTSLCPFCGGGRKPESAYLPRDWNRLSRRAIFAISGECAQSLKGKRLPLPDGTRIYGSGIEQDFFYDRILIRVMHPDLYRVEEGERLPFVDPIFEDTETGGLRFVSWYAND